MISLIMYCFVIENSQWTELLVENSEKDYGIAYHTMTACFMDKTSLLYQERIEKKKVSILYQMEYNT